VPNYYFRIFAKDTHIKDVVASDLNAAHKAFNEELGGESQFQIYDGRSFDKDQIVIKPWIDYDTPPAPP
tara:strand:- start:3 stop:209 length:207 start_codon:yes stop_codon:yes gene_type:complete